MSNKKNEVPDIMTSLYSIQETNTDETKNQNTQKIEMLFGFKNNSYEVFDTEYNKYIICVCGSCDLYIENNEKHETIKLNNPNVTICLDKNVKTKLQNLTKDTKVIIEYLRENNEL